LVRTKTLVKNAIVQIDGQPFKQWYAKKYVLVPSRYSSRARYSEEAVATAI